MSNLPGLDCAPKSSRTPSACAETPTLRPRRDTEHVAAWDAFDPEDLFEAIHARGPHGDAARTVWAFERALSVARLDPELLRHLLVACVCLVATEEGTSPRAVLEQLFRRSVSDAEWRDRFEPLFV